VVAFDVLEPALRSRGGITDRAKQLYKKHEFREQMIAVFSGEATGCLRIRSLAQACKRIDELESRLREIEARLADQDGC
jgi:hypothetical protein